MSKLSKAQIKQHREACALLEKDVLSQEERWFVAENWQESAAHINSEAGAFFTPADLACDFTIEVGGGRIVDLCAGIGMLSLAVIAGDREKAVTSLTCVEVNPHYVEVGRKVVPEATWICCSIFDDRVFEGKRFDYAISNPPFGNIKRPGAPRRFQNGPFELAMLAVAAEIADYGVFIIPKSAMATSPVLQRSCIDATYHADAWRGVSPRVEVAIADFEALSGQPVFELTSPGVPA